MENIDKIKELLKNKEISKELLFELTIHTLNTLNRVIGILENIQDRLNDLEIRAGLAFEDVVFKEMISNESNRIIDLVKSLKDNKELFS